jgi:hypothetical protein
VVSVGWEQIPEALAGAKFDLILCEALALVTAEDANWRALTDSGVPIVRLGHVAGEAGVALPRPFKSVQLRDLARRLWS